MTRLRRAVGAATALALAVTVLSTTNATGSSPTAPAASPQASTATKVAAVAASKVTWKTCTNGLQEYGLQCATLKVPLDYSKPKGKKITLALSRARHTTASYQGIMLVNPGGPGGSGLIYSVLQRFVPSNAGASYDWIGFDPRGVGESTPALACDAKYAGYDRPNYVPTTKKLEKIWLKRSKGYAKDCAKGKTRRNLIKHLKTIDTVKDMDSIRKALGESMINYYGFSYGTYLGQVYATKYPNRVRRMIFDGTVNPKRVWYAANLDQDRAFERTENIFFAWVAKYNSYFRLGQTRPVIAANYYRQMRLLNAKPKLGIGPDELNDVLLSAGYYVFGWKEIGDAFADLVIRGDARGIRALYDQSVDQSKGGDNGFAIYNGVQCTDTKWPQKWSTWRKDNWRTYAKAPFLTWGNAWFNAPCLYWKAKPGKAVKVTGKKVNAKILMISETLDAATPYSGSLEVRKLFKGASLIEGVGGTTHAGSLSGIACTDNAIATYLARGTVPARRAGNRSDLQCSPVPQPDPTVADQSRQGADRQAALQVELRKLLQQAQRPFIR